MPGTRLTFLFWNVQGKDLTTPLGQLIAQHQVDFVILAEMGISPPATQTKLAASSGVPVFSVNNSILTSKTHVFSTLPSTFARHFHATSTGRLSMYHCAVPLWPGFILTTVHLASKLHLDQPTLTEEARIVMQEARDQATNQGLTRTIICGDFNQNPFDDAMTGAANFNATMSADYASRGHRTVHGRKYPLLYNPMWSLLGDYQGRVPGSYYNSGSDHYTTHWHILDQFLLSPELLSAARILHLEIVTTFGGNSLLRPSGRIERNAYSDHLPIIITLELL